MIRAVMAEAGSRANVAYKDELLENTRVRGVSAEYDEFSGYATELGRLPSRLEIAARPAGGAARLGHRGSSCSRAAIRSSRSIQINGVHFRVIGVSEKKGSVFGNSQDEFAVIPLGVVPASVRARRSLELTVKPAIRRSC